MLISAVIIWFVSTLNFKWMSQHSAIAHGFLILKIYRFYALKQYLHFLYLWNSIK